MKYDKDLYENIELLKEFILTKIITNYETQVKRILNNTDNIELGEIKNNIIRNVIFNYYDEIEIRTIENNSTLTGLWFKPEVGKEIKLTSIDVFQAFEDWKLTKTNCE